MDAIETIMSRFSPMRLVEPGPDRVQTEALLAAGARAPDSGRLRPFRFLVIDGDARETFGALLSASLARRKPTATAEMLQREARKPLATPLIIVIACQVAPNPHVRELDQILAGGAAAQNMLLAAHAMGFAAIWRTGPAADDDALKTQLGFAAGDALIGFLHFGTLGARPPAADGDFASITRWLQAHDELDAPEEMRSGRHLAAKQSWT